MSSEDEYKRVYTGSEVNVQYLQQLLKEEDIETIVRNEFQSGLRGGFGGGLPGQVQLLALASHYEEAVKLAKETFPNQDL